MPSLPTTEVNLNYVQVGAGENVVLIHGLGANLSFWYFGAARMLSAHHNVLMYDLRGHGRSSMPRLGYGLRSMADDLANLMTSLDVEAANVVGHSFGGRVALAFAALHPRRVRNVVVADTQIDALQAPMRLADWAYWPTWRKELQAHGLTQPPSDDSIIDYKLLAELGRFGGDLANTGQAGPRRLSLRAQDMGARSSRRWQQLLTETSAGREFEDEGPIERKTLSSVVAPTLLMYGKYSHCLPTAAGLLEHLPNAQLLVVPGAGHFFPARKPLVFARALERFLSGTAAETRAGAMARRRRLGAGMQMLRGA